MARHRLAIGLLAGILTLAALLTLAVGLNLTGGDPLHAAGSGSDEL